MYIFFTDKESIRTYIYLYIYIYFKVDKNFLEPINHLFNYSLYKMYAAEKSTTLNYKNIMKIIIIKLKKYSEKYGFSYTQVS